MISPCLLLTRLHLADTSTLKFNDEHAPKENSIEAFGLIAQKIKDEILKSRKHWDAVSLLLVFQDGSRN